MIVSLSWAHPTFLVKPLSSFSISPSLSVSLRLSLIASLLLCLSSPRASDRALARPGTGDRGNVLSRLSRAWTPFLAIVWSVAFCAWPWPFIACCPFPPRILCTAQPAASVVFFSQGEAGLGHWRLTHAPLFLQGPLQLSQVLKLSLATGPVFPLFLLCLSFLDYHCQCSRHAAAI